MTKEGKGSSSVRQASKKVPPQGCMVARDHKTVSNMGRPAPEKTVTIWGHWQTSGCGFLEDPNVPSNFSTSLKKKKKITSPGSAGLPDMFWRYFSWGTGCPWVTHLLLWDALVVWSARLPHHKHNVKTPNMNRRFCGSVIYTFVAVVSYGVSESNTRSLVL